MLDAYLRKKLKVHSIEALLGGPFTARPTDRGVPGKADATVTVSCVQREIAPIRRIEDYIAHMEGFVKAAFCVDDPDSPVFGDPCFGFKPGDVRRSPVQKKHAHVPASGQVICNNSNPEFHEKFAGGRGQG